jgi:hypothetical protein
MVDVDGWFQGIGIAATGMRLEMWKGKELRSTLERAMRSLAVGWMGWTRCSQWPVLDYGD